MAEIEVNGHSWVEKDYDPSKYNYRKTALEGLPNYGYPSNYFFADSIRNVSIAFGSFFDEIHVVRHDENGFPAKNIRVPIKMGPRMKAQDYRIEIERGEKYYISYPNLSYSFDDIAWDGERARGLTTIRDFYKEMFDSDIANEMFWEDVQPAPYNMTFSLVLNCENMSDMTSVVEQVCSKFRPDNYLFVKEFWWFNKRRSMKMHLEGVSQVVQKELTSEIKRIYTVTFTFKVEAYLYTPIKTAYVIDTIKTKIAAQMFMPKTSTIEGLSAYSGTNDFYQLTNGGILNSGLGTWYEMKAEPNNIVTWEEGSRDDGFGYWSIYAKDSTSLVSTIDISGRRNGNDADGNPRNFDTSAIMGAINVNASDISMPIDSITNKMYDKIYHITSHSQNVDDCLVIGYNDKNEPMTAIPAYDSYVTFDYTNRYWKNAPISITSGQFESDGDNIEYIVREEWKGGI